MKRFLLLFCVVSATLRADPMLDLGFAQYGNDVVLGWNIVDPGENYGVTVFLEGHSPRGYTTGNYLGWWRTGTTMTITGTVTGGYDPALGQEPEYLQSQPGNPAYWDYVFTPGSHNITLWLHRGSYDGVVHSTPDGPRWNDGRGGPTVQLKGTYTVQPIEPVPDATSTASLLGLAIAALVVARRWQSHLA